MGSQSKRKKGTKDNRNITADLKREADQDANRTALQPTFEGLAFSPIGITQTDYVDVTETIDPLQTNAPTIPAQVTGLNVTTGSNNNTLNLTWTASISVGVIYYNIYRSIISGNEVLIDSVFIPTVTYSDTNLISGTTYYYKVSAVNDVGMEGTLSSEDSATTTGTAPPILPTLLLHLDGNLTDSSGNGCVTVLGGGNPTNGNGYQTPGKFGSSAIRLATPTDNASNYDVLSITNDSIINMNLSVGFSISLWFWPTDISLVGGGLRRYLLSKTDSPSPGLNDTQWQITFDAAGVLYFAVKEAGVEYKRQISGLVTGSWQHIVAVFDGVSNTVQIYRNAVAGATSSATIIYGGGSDPSMMIGGTYVVNTHVEGYVDEVQYFQQVLTPTQITNLMNTNTP